MASYFCKQKPYIDMTENNIQLGVKNSW